MALGRNILANFGGQAATTIIALVTVPFYLRFLGADGYGLVSFVLVLQGLTGVLDLGLSTTANREVTRYRADEAPASARQDLVRSLEAFYAAVAVLIFIAVATAGPPLVAERLAGSAIPTSQVRACMILAAATLALRWPTALYHGILRGAEQQVTLNLAVAATNLVRGVGSIGVLVLLARDVVTFYWWQLAFGALELGLLRHVARRRSGGFTGHGGAVRVDLLRGLWRFSLDVGAVSLFALALKQVDKVVVAAFMNLSQLGYYNAASLAAAGLGKLAQPVQAAIFPRFTHLIQRREEATLATAFHGAVQGVALLTAPLACVFAFFPQDVLWLWTRDRALAAAASPALALLAAAMILNGLMSVPFALMLAAGTPRIPMAMNGIGALLMVPLTIVLVRGYGLAGAAVGWLAFNVANYVLVPVVMFRRVLPGEYRAWLRRDTLPFLAAALACFGGARLLAGTAPLPVRFALVLAAAAAFVSLMLLTSPQLRALVRAARRVA